MPVKISSGFFGACFALLCLSLGVRASLVLCWGLVCSGLAVKVFGACCELYCATSWLSVCVFLGPCDPGRLCVSLMLGPHLGQMGHTAITHFNVHVSRERSLRFEL